jgi:hypothetical protein
VRGEDVLWSGYARTPIRSVADALSPRENRSARAIPGLHQCDIILLLIEKAIIVPGASWREIFQKNLKERHERGRTQKRGHFNRGKEF